MASKEEIVQGFQNLCQEQRKWFYLIYYFERATFITGKQNVLHLDDINLSFRVNFIEIGISLRWLENLYWHYPIVPHII